MVKSNQFQVISSKFTREEGYIDIQSSQKMEYNKAIQLLNSFTPQGASPKMSIRIGTWNGNIGLGYYQMQDNENAKLSTILMPPELGYERLSQIPLTQPAIAEISDGNHQKFLQHDNLEPLDILDIFGKDHTSMILYSILSGDNMIIIHPEHKERVHFIKGLLELIPGSIFRYNRITTGCAELDGNENIIGVERLPRKYRSHKKLYMPLDTIFIDLKENRITGEGLKTNDFMKEIIVSMDESKHDARQLLQGFFDDISKPKFKEYTKYGENSQMLTDKIRTKLGFETTENDDWFMAF